MAAAANLEGGEHVGEILCDVVMHLGCQLHPSGPPTNLNQHACFITQVTECKVLTG